MTKSYNPPSTALRYSGPVRLPTGDGASDDTITVNITTVDNGQANVSGQIAFALTTADLVNSPDYSGYADAYHEYRVMAMEVEWLNNYSQTFTLDRRTGVGKMAVEHIATVSPPGSLSIVAAHQSNKTWHSGSTLKMHWRMNAVEEALFNDVGAPASHGGIIGWIDDLSTNEFYGKFVTTYLVQFRNRR